MQFVAKVNGKPDIYDLIDIPIAMRIEIDVRAEQITVGNHRPRHAANTRHPSAKY